MAGERMYPILPFSIVDVGGNRLRFYGSATDEGEGGAEAGTGLGRVVEVAAGQAHSRGADDQALSPGSGGTG